VTDVGPAGWFPDPYQRFELRYFNGQRWTGDVSMQGRQMVDARGTAGWSPGDDASPRSGPEPSRALAVAAFITSLCAAATGWIPLVFTASALAAVVGFVLGVVALGRARRQDGFGRDFAAWAVALAVAAVPICVAGFFFTRYVVQQVDHYDDPGSYTVTHGNCTASAGTATFDGTITNNDDAEHSYELTIVYSTGLAEVGRQYVDVDDVQPGATAHWTNTDKLSTTSNDVTCDVTAVHGPPPFGVRPE
jgi:hypothetical protein